MCDMVFQTSAQFYASTQAVAITQVQAQVGLGLGLVVTLALLINSGIRFADTSESGLSIMMQCAGDSIANMMIEHLRRPSFRPFAHDTSC